MIINSKEIIINDLSNFDNKADHVFTKALFIICFLEKWDIINAHDLITKNLNFKDEIW